MKWKYQVSFEHDVNPVETFKGELTGSNVGVAARRAINESKKKRSALKSRSKFTSLVCVLVRVEEK